MYVLETGEIWGITLSGASWAGDWLYLAYQMRSFATQFGVKTMTASVLIPDGRFVGIFENRNMNTP
jgi:hypothetical protein